MNTPHTSFTSNIRVWLAAARPRTLPAAAAPVMIGAAMAAADGGFHLGAATAALLGALLIQIGANYANDYYDFVKGADTSARLGPTRATQAGLVSPVQMRYATGIVLGAALAPGLYLVYRGGWPIVIIGILSLLLAVLYTGGPLPLGYIGVADFFVLMFFGPIAVAGAYYVQRLEITPAPVSAGFATGLLSMGILTVNNLRDLDQDKVAGKRTLAVRFGPTFARIEYALAVTLALSVVPVVTCALHGGRWGALMALAMLVPALRLIKTVYSTSDGPTLNACLAGTGQLLLGFSMLFSLGWLL